jgi:hypothetical protein
MIARSYITGNLQAINRSYQQASSQRDSLLFSKLAILELCGWIEESMDDVVLRCAMRHLKLLGNRTYCKKEFVQRTYGFEYHRNFRFMLVRLIGLVNVEYIEARVNQAKRDAMTAALASLTTQRNLEAHTHVRGTTRRINAPSVTIAQFPLLYDGLEEFDRVIRDTRW